MTRAVRPLGAGALALSAFIALSVPATVFPQAGAGAPTAAQLREVLIWNSPWEGRATPPQLYSFRTVFRLQRGVILAETTSYATNQRATSVVTITGARLAWQDANGAEVNVGLAESGELVGTAESGSRNLQIVFRPRP